MVEHDVRWDLSELAPHPDLAHAIAAAQNEAERFLTRWKPKFSPAITEHDFSAALHEYIKIIDTLSRLSSYISLQLSTATADGTLLAQRGLLDAAESSIIDHLRPFTHWIKGLDTSTVHRLASAVGMDAYWVKRTHQLGKHTLAEREEMIITRKDPNGAQTLSRAYDLIDARMVFTLTAHGKTEELSDEQLRSRFSHPDPVMRRAAYDTFYATMAKERDLLGLIYCATVRDWEVERSLRGYGSAIGMRNVGNDLPDEVVDAHLAACRDGRRVWQRYFALKERALGIAVTRYDIYAPLDTVDRKTTFEEAVAMTLSAFTSFSPRLGHLAKEIYDRKHVDAFPRAGKRSGAFCAGVVPGLPPYLLYNHTGRLRDAFTVAHETGHGVHSQMTRDKSILSGGHALPIAETASVFGEMLLSESLLAAADAETKKALIVQKLNDMYATVGRQSFFTLWEREAHRIVVAGGTIDDVSSAYMDSLREQFGDMEIPDSFKDEWIGIPHFFHSPFYCYAYSFGNLLTLALYATYREEGAAFVPKFEAFLAAGETADPVTLCKMVGVDIGDAAFWKSGFKIIEEMLDELERLI